MSLLTVGQLKAEIRSIHGGRTDADTRLNSLLDLSQQRLCRLHDFDELRSVNNSISTVLTASPAADKIISLAPLGRYRKIYSMRLYAGTASRSRKLEKVLPKNWDTLIPEPEFYSRGVPSHYTIWGKDQMELYKVPDAVYTIWTRMSRWPNVVSGDGQLLDLENVDDLIIHLTASYLFMSFGNMERANELFAIYAALAKEAIGEEEEDFDTVQAAFRAQSMSNKGLGYNDPFTHSTSIVQD